MPVSLEDVQHIALLARLGLAPEEAESLRRDLDSILGYVAKLDSLDTRDVEATAHVVDLPTPLRDDVAANPEVPEDMVRNAPDRDRTFLRVPKIIE
ncbi:MAG TPA: Asp-tRNA(Asn)/Glu-tRNA(Gln) amidotransferase subunit GatC [Candidatus Binatia bacterium]|nr:Asp-tRNA(Asn)/Glu-tRNA(Gln) amidotransferase subunit GatC [Candidatus Binatia bacterium]